MTEFDTFMEEKVKLYQEYNIFQQNQNKTNPTGQNNNQEEEVPTNNPTQTGGTQLNTSTNQTQTGVEQTPTGATDTQTNPNAQQTNPNAQQTNPNAQQTDPNAEAKQTTPQTAEDVMNVLTQALQDPQMKNQLAPLFAQMLQDQQVG